MDDKTSIRLAILCSLVQGKAITAFTTTNWATLAKNLDAMVAMMPLPVVTPVPQPSTGPTTSDPVPTTGTIATISLDDLPAEVVSYAPSVA
jgi:hypothetical protein